MILDALFHSQVDLETPERLLYGYTRIYAGIIETAFPGRGPIDTFSVGGGGYVFPRYIELTRPGSLVEVAEIDPAVTEAAREAFGLPADSSIEIHHMDARNRVSELVRQKEDGHHTRAFDCIFGDSFSGFAIPYHLTTLEFTQDLADLLKDDGMYLLNVVDVFSSGRLLGPALHTCRAVFPHVYLLASGTAFDKRSTFVIACSKRPLDTTSIVSQVQERYDMDVRIPTQEELASLTARSADLLLTDDFAPVENLISGLWKELPSWSEQSTP